MWDCSAAWHCSAICYCWAAVTASPARPCPPGPAVVGPTPAVCPPARVVQTAVCAIPTLLPLRGVVAGMERRRVLRRVCAAPAVAVAGCLAGTDEPDGSGGTGTSAVDEQPCPPYETDRDRAVCSHTVDPETATLYLDPEPRSSRLDGGTPEREVALTLHNRSTTDLRFNPHSWRLHRRSGGEWTALERQQAGDGTVTVPAGDARSWTLAEAAESIRAEPAFQPGLYAAEIGVPDPENDGWVACIALVELEPGE